MTTGLTPIFSVLQIATLLRPESVREAHTNTSCAYSGRPVFVPICLPYPPCLRARDGCSGGCDAQSHGKAQRQREDPSETVPKATTCLRSTRSCLLAARCSTNPSRRCDTAQGFDPSKPSARGARSCPHGRVGALQPHWSELPSEGPVNNRRERNQEVCGQSRRHQSAADNPDTTLGF
jgi:hypothetical protein